MIKIVAIVFLAVFALISCENNEKKEEAEKNFSCAGISCQSNSDCTCSAAFCMLPAIVGMPTVGPINAERCTVLNCDVEDVSTCPTGYECWALSMGKDYFPEGTESVCIKIPEEVDDDDDTINQEFDDDIIHDEVEDSWIDDADSIDIDSNIFSDVDEIMTDNETQDEDSVDLWPSCYDQTCESSDDCCEGTKCLSKMAEMDPNISESEYCVIKDCTEGDDTTCPSGHTCLNSMMGNYCVKL